MLAFEEGHGSLIASHEGLDHSVGLRDPGLWVSCLNALTASGVNFRDDESDFLDLEDEAPYNF